ncbi:hypothetical protein W02_21730 [Nitrospira sp. KM1]|uniref:hypothetical protein n=1 Tax=Nitrospira sp. KM1 TaxID=1936990 RepID=UPI0013A7266F|nr:hypothetical protein [Nitrospira sp. KM1]BCA55033.1 hypothetical protein W02_21730 [Nitrospira sp. KM1]
MKVERLGIVMLGLSVTLCAGTLSLLFVQPFTAKAQEVKRIQYRIVEVLHDTDAMQRTLNEFGGSGWELVTVSAGDLTSPRMIFRK